MELPRDAEEIHEKLLCPDKDTNREASEYDSIASPLRLSALSLGYKL
jgi:hypothetical protein